MPKQIQITSDPVNGKVIVTCDPPYMGVKKESIPMRFGGRLKLLDDESVGDIVAIVLRHGGTIELHHSMVSVDGQEFENNSDLYDAMDAIFKFDPIP